MDQRIEAIFENGVFKPLSEVALPDHLHVVLRIENGDVAAVEEEVEIVARQKRAAAALDAELEHVPDYSPGGSDIARSAGLIPWKGDLQDLQHLLGPDNLPWGES